MTTEKVRENRARRAVERRGYVLRKSRRRDPAAWDYGTWKIIDYSGSRSGQLVLDSSTLGEIEAWLDSTKAGT